MVLTCDNLLLSTLRDRYSIYLSIYLYICLYRELYLPLRVLKTAVLLNFYDLYFYSSERYATGMRAMSICGHIFTARFGQFPRSGFLSFLPPRNQI